MAKQQLNQLRDYLNKMILGQSELVDSLLIALLADGHILVESPPGLAKTRAINALSDGIEGDFHRIQFTPDLLPSDVTGTDIFRQETGQFIFEKGPIFHNLILADEINRAPAKVQSALLEAMAERQVTVGKTTYPLPPLFLVMATQNPLEQEGTYPLPEAQLDRFIMHLQLDYPDADTERLILQLNQKEILKEKIAAVTPLLNEQIFAMREEVMKVSIAPHLEQYLIDLIMATRQPERFGEKLGEWISYGASPRATLALMRTAKARAWLNDRDYVMPEDIISNLYPVLRHRLILSYEAEAQGLNANQVIQEIINQVAIAG
ncbi:MoxR family ATPase [Psychromonas sp. 14N.309.X.WAT.B.A12]|uniref:AAA family ATPase n=1 Tax=unclassified Psychromonas TaxID=2614957 RepID=UPI0025B10073|nr:MoxR family ATPase [Psychromonas sp. 14N.309.X.WAT.B.A12]MDN2662524.1 MoxR family ATPase [Psychromonas sp. 14N.309.X.WAT.B.A12]